MFSKSKIFALPIGFVLVILIVLPAIAKTINSESTNNGATWGFRNNFLTCSGNVSWILTGSNPDYSTFHRGSTTGSRISNGQFTPAQVRIKITSYETSSIYPNGCNLRDTGWVTGVGPISASNRDVKLIGTLVFCAFSQEFAVRVKWFLQK